MASRRWHYCVLDEGHIIRNPKARVAQARPSLNARLPVQMHWGARPFTRHHVVLSSVTHLVCAVRSGSVSIFYQVVTARTSADFWAP